MSEIDLTPTNSSPRDDVEANGLTSRPADEESIPADKLRALMPRLGEEAKRRAFAAGVSIVILKDGRLVEIHANGQQMDLGAATIPTLSGIS